MGRMRKKKYIGERLERASALLCLDPPELREFLTPENVCELEIGCGKGSFLIQAARAHPETRFVAFEREENALIIAAENVLAEGLTNLRFVSDDAKRLLEFLRPGEVSRIYVNFCDPWPGNRHAKRRLTASGFLDLYRTLLTPGGELLFKTDNLELFEFSRKSLESHGWNLELGRCSEWLTDYERKFLEQGKTIHKLGAIVTNG